MSVGGARAIGVGDVERGGERAETGDVSRAVAGGDLPCGDVERAVLGELAVLDAVLGDRAVLGERGTHPCADVCAGAPTLTVNHESPWLMPREVAWPPRGAGMAAPWTHTLSR